MPFNNISDNISSEGINVWPAITQSHVSQPAIPQTNDGSNNTEVK